MSQFPWEEGFVPAKPMTPEELHARQVEITRKGHEQTYANKERRANGEEPVYSPNNRQAHSTARNDPETYKRKGRNPDSPREKMLARKTTELISMEETARVNAFVDAYLQCFDAPKAWVMAGGSLGQAIPKGYEMLRWPAVIERMNTLVEELEEEKLLTRKMVLMGLLKEANHHGGDATHGGRIRAWMGLARIKKMDVQVTESNVTVNGGVMVIPMPDDGNTVDGWARWAEDGQRQLKEEVRK